MDCSSFWSQRTQQHMLVAESLETLLRVPVPAGACFAHARRVLWSSQRSALGYVGGWYVVVVNEEQSPPELVHFLCPPA